MYNLKNVEKYLSKEEMKYYRITYNNDGIYNAFKNCVEPNVWKSFLNDKKNCQWLPKPPSYTNKNKSYFTDKGFNKFMKTTYNVFKKYMDVDKIKIEKISNIGNIIYKDKYQVVAVHSL